MIIFFGPAGAGKSVQGQILSARHGWRWLSAGQLLRDSRDPELLKEMSSGDLVSESRVNTIIKDALVGAKDIDKVILDGYPRQISQAQWLVETEPEHEQSIQMVVVLEVPRAEIERRLKVRGRADDTPDVIDKRLQIYRQEIYPILDYLNDLGVYITHLDGTGTVGQVHDRIESELVSHRLVEA
jgi:adenylate kinase